MVSNIRPIIFVTKFSENNMHTRALTHTVHTGKKAPRTPFLSGMFRMSVSRCLFWSAGSAVARSSA